MILSIRKALPPILIEYLVVAVLVSTIGAYLVYQSSIAIHHVPRVGSESCGGSPPLPCTEQQVKTLEELRWGGILRTLGILAGFGALDVFIIWRGRKAKLKHETRH